MKSPQQNNSEPLSAIQISRQQLCRQQNWQGSLSRDLVVAEEPLAIYLHWRDNEGKDQHSLLSITMRTPGDDNALALGLLFAEGIIAGAEAISHMAYQDSNEQDELLHQNQLDVFFTPGLKPNHQLYQRQMAGNSSCGVCGKTSIQAIELSLQGKLDDTEHWLSADVLAQLPEKLRQHQKLFAQTGGVHASGLFNVEGQLLWCKEDVGRHNALDKVIGQALSQGWNLCQSVVMVSGRVSFELVQKCVMASVPVLVAVGAPSSLAIRAAQQFNLTLIGFCNESTMNVYHGDWRIKK